MPLTDAQKRKIEEEEAYRATLREDHESRKAISSHHQTPSKSTGGCRNGCLTVIVIISIFLAITLIAINPAKQFESAEKTANTLSLETKTGSFEDSYGTEYTYKIAFEEGEEKFVASYTPFLVNDDRTLLMAIFEAFKTAYGNDGQIVPTPILEARNGTNLIKFTGDGQMYYVLPIKEDTGEIHTLMFWKE